VNRFPYTIVDNFFKDPDSILAYAKTLQYTQDNPRYPGWRSKNIREVNPDLWQEIVAKIALLFADYSDGDDWEVHNISADADMYFQKSDGAFDIGHIHRDFCMTAMIYLSEGDENENEGTSLYKKRKDILIPQLDPEDYKQELIANRDGEGWREYCKNCAKQFYKTLDVKNEYNRLFIFDEEYHAANKMSDDRYFMVIFFNNLTMRNYPIERKNYRSVI